MAPDVNRRGVGCWSGHGLLCASMAACAIASSGGTALAGLILKNTEPGSFIDISGIGIPLNLSDDGHADITTTVNNSLFAAGTWRIGNNGGMGLNVAPSPFGLPNAPGPNQTLPNPLVFGGNKQALCPGWDNEGDSTGNVYWLELPGDKLIVQWHMRNVGTSGNTTTFQVQIPDTIPLFDGILAQFIYQDVEQFPEPAFGTTFTIGYQASDLDPIQDNSTTWSPRQVHNGEVLSLVKDVPAPGPITILLGAGVVCGARRRRA